MATSDPAVVDRRHHQLIVAADFDLPVRTMVISGLDGRLDARILSKDHSGPATRLVRVPLGWGTAQSGAFTADIELFVIEGRLTVAGHEIGQYDYFAVRAGQLIRGLRADTPAVALLMTSAPIRYDTSAGGALAQPQVARAAEETWAAVDRLPGRYVRELAQGPAGAVYISGAREWANDGGPWHYHDGPEEMFVLDGSFTVLENVEGRPIEQVYLPGSYVHRASGVYHAGPGSSSSERAIAYHRVGGTGLTTWNDVDETG